MNPTARDRLITDKPDALPGSGGDHWGAIEWELSILETSEEFCCTQCFDCGDPDLNEFFSQDAIPHREELLAETYVFRYRATENEEPVPVAFKTHQNPVFRSEAIQRRKLISATHSTPTTEKQQAAGQTPRKGQVGEGPESTAETTQELTQSRVS